MDEQLISKVWHIPSLVGNAVAGVLIWDKGQIIFITEEGVQFNVQLAEMRDIKWPFLRMGFGFNAVVNGKKYKFSFSKPNHSSPEINIIEGNPFPKVEFARQYFYDISSLGTIKADKNITKKWKTILEGR
jgi:hypothetical protein